MLNFSQILAQKIQQNQQSLNDFFAKKFSLNPPLFYNSVDLRHSGFKIAAIDTNCFPAGFNNLDNHSKAIAKQLTSNFIQKKFPAAKKAIIIAENHSRNLPYLRNLVALQEILGSAVQTRIAMFDANLINQTSNFDSPENSPEFIELSLDNSDLKNNLKIFHLQNRGGRLFAGADFASDIALLNNDLTAGLPEILQNCYETAIFPLPNLGWFARSKAKHFEIYQKLADEAAKILKIDSWLISALSQKVSNVNFKQQLGLENLALAVDELLAKISQKYQQHGITQQARCFVKADNGTYGMAVWLVESGDEINKINKKERNKMNVIKSSVITSEVIIQEALPTLDSIDGSPCEPLIYLVLGEVVANLFRCNKERDEKISLNAAGAEFFDLKNLRQPNNISNQTANYQAIYWLIARLAAAAAAIEETELK